MKSKASLLRQAERAEVALPGEKKAPGRTLCIFQHPKEGEKGVFFTRPSNDSNRGNGFEMSLD